MSIKFARVMFIVLDAEEAVRHTLNKADFSPFRIGKPGGWMMLRKIAKLQHVLDLSMCGSPCDEPCSDENTHLFSVSLMSGEI